MIWLQRTGRRAPADGMSLVAVTGGSVVALALALLAVGCGEAATSTGSFKGQSHAVAQAISSFQSNASTGNEKEICQKYLSSELKVKLEKGGTVCAKALEEQLREVDTFTLTVESVAVNGTNATAKVSSTFSGKPKISTLSLVKEAGSWKISGTG
jgi:ABC-type oligopeptide transport system substrate-binding subunit